VFAGKKLGYDLIDAQIVVDEFMNKLKRCDIAKIEV
jgi:hypothetical protein